ncbi:MAG TPA: hypothetical protein VIP70_11520 [Nitrososphaeraceae archaeon]
MLIYIVLIGIKKTYCNIIKLFICINDNNNSIAALAAMMSNFGLPLTSSMSVGFTIGFMKG